MKKWLLAAGGLLAGLALAEVVCRVTLDDPGLGVPDGKRTTWRVEGLIADPDVQFSFQPGYEGRITLAGDYDVPFKINSQGLRDDHDFGPRGPRQPRILLVGDSFVFGIGVELQDTLGELLERALNEDGSGAPPVEVVSVGVPAYDLDAYAVLLERWVPQLLPDLVIMTLYPGNDLVDYELKAQDRQVVIEGHLVKQRQAWSWNLRKYSALASLVLQRFNPYGRIDRYRPLHPRPEDISRMFHSMQPWIERITRARGRGGPPLAVWVVPTPSMLGDLSRDDMDRLVPPLRGVLNEFIRLGNDVFEPVEAWRNAPRPFDQYFFKVDTHFSAAGNRLMAEWLAPQLREKYARELLDDEPIPQAAETPRAGEPGAPGGKTTPAPTGPH